MKIQEVKVGYWYSHCCYLDLAKIEKEEDLIEFKEGFESLVEEELGLPDVFKTKLEGLYFFKDAFSDVKSLNDIEKLIYEELKTKREMKTVVTKEQAIKDLKEIFQIKEPQDKTTWIDAYEMNGSFGINKQFMERFPVIDKLTEYFSDKMFAEGLGLVVGSITLIYTTFKIKEIKP